MDYVHNDVCFLSLHDSVYSLWHRMVLYMMYYPSHLKYAAVEVDMHDNRPATQIKTSVKRDEWQLSIVLSWVVLLYT